MTTTPIQAEFEFTYTPNTAGEQTSLPLDYYTITGGNPATLTCVPRRNVTFLDANGAIVGELNWDDGPMKFSGDAEYSAKVFFDAVIKQYRKWTGISPTP